MLNNRLPLEDKMDSIFICHRIDCAPRRWKDAAASMVTDGAERIKIGRITIWFMEKSNWFAP